LGAAFTSIFSKSDCIVVEITPKNGVFSVSARISKVFRVMGKQAVMAVSWGDILVAVVHDRRSEFMLPGRGRALIYWCSISGWMRV
jgi:hypothetical protein